MKAPKSEQQKVSELKAEFFSQWKQPRLMLLGMEPVEYPALQIWAHRVLDGAGHTVCGAHSKSEAETIRARYAARFPGKSFYVD